jgi:Protein of unknown function (DUF1214)
MRDDHPACCFAHGGLQALPVALSSWPATSLLPQAIPLSRRLRNSSSTETHRTATPPEADKQANWLPAPKEGDFKLALRLYAPKKEVADGTWTPPRVKRAARSRDNGEARYGEMTAELFSSEEWARPTDDVNHSLPKGEVN